MGFGGELLFIIAFGLVVLGPKRMHTVLKHAARVKAQFQEATGAFKSQLTSELEVLHPEHASGTSNDAGTDQ